MSKRITLAQLEAVGACPEALDWFAARFPEGATLAQAVAAAAAADRRDWIGWWAVEATNLTFAERDALCDRCAAPRYWRAMVATFGPGLTLGERHALYERSSDPATRRPPAYP